MGRFKLPFSSIFGQHRSFEPDRWAQCVKRSGIGCSRKYEIYYAKIVTIGTPRSPKEKPRFFGEAFVRTTAIVLATLYVAFVLKFQPKPPQSEQPTAVVKLSFTSLIIFSFAIANIIHSHPLSSFTTTILT